MKMGEAAAASGCHVESIRYYERIGLLPRAPRTHSGYRTYAEDDVRRLRFITRGRELGFSLEEIGSLLALSDDGSLSCQDVDRLARQHLGMIKERIRQLTRMARELERTITGCSGGRRAQCTILDALRVTAPRARAAREASTPPF